MKSLIIGAGEVGMAVREVLSKVHDCTIIDSLKGIETTEIGFEILHICFGFSDKFVEQVKEYQERFKPKFTVIYTTCPPGTTRQVNGVHSPVIGKHPNLAKSIQTFTRMLSGEQASDVAEYFNRAGLRVYLFDKPECTEVFKVSDLEYFRLEIEFTKDMKRRCEKYGIPFEGWTIYNQIYNQGYKELGYENHIRPNLIPVMTKIKGHCVSQNSSMIQTPFTELLKELNEKHGSAT